MGENQEISSKSIASHNLDSFDSLVINELKIVPLNASENILFNGIQSEKEEVCAKFTVISPKIKSTKGQDKSATNLFRLFVKNGEYIYARPNDIIMIESCDHLVKVYLAFNEVVKKAIRPNTLKDILLQLPQDQFIRIGRFCAVNINRLSGGNCKEQTFEFDFNVSIKLKHSISQAVFNTIGK